MPKKQEDDRWRRLSDDMVLLTQYLKIIDISFFQFVRIHKNGQIVTLANNIKWMEIFLKDKLYLKGIFSANVFDLNDGNYLWESEPDSEIYDTAKTHFQIDHGITIFRKYKNYADSYLFATDENDHFIHDIYLNNINVLLHFIDFFESISDEKILKSGFKIQTNKVYGVNDKNKRQTKLYNKIKAFINKIKIKSYAIENQLAIVFLVTIRNS